MPRTSAPPRAATPPRTTTPTTTSNKGDKIQHEGHSFYDDDGETLPPRTPLPRVLMGLDATSAQKHVCSSDDKDLHHNDNDEKATREMKTGLSEPPKPPTDEKDCRYNGKHARSPDDKELHHNGKDEKATREMEKGFSEHDDKDCHDSGSEGHCIHDDDGETQPPRSPLPRDLKGFDATSAQKHVRSSDDKELHHNDNDEKATREMETGLSEHDKDCHYNGKHACSSDDKELHHNEHDEEGFGDTDFGDTGRTEDWLAKKVAEFKTRPECTATTLCSYGDGLLAEHFPNLDRQIAMRRLGEAMARLEGWESSSERIARVMTDRPHDLNYEQCVDLAAELSRCSDGCRCSDGARDLAYHIYENGAPTACHQDHMLRKWVQMAHDQVADGDRASAACEELGRCLWTRTVEWDLDEPSDDDET